MGLEVAEECFWVGVAIGIDVEVVVSSAPGAIEEHGANGDIVLSIPFKQFVDGVGGVGIILPEPTLERPWRSERWASMALGVEWESPERMDPEHEHEEESDREREDEGLEPFTAAQGGGDGMQWSGRNGAQSGESEVRCDGEVVAGELVVFGVV